MQNENEQKFKVMFGENKIIGGVMYGKGVYELTAEKALSAIKEGGVMSAQDQSALERFINSQPTEGAPLSLEETLERFQNFDFSDDVMRSMQYHQTAIQSKMNPTPATYGDKPPVSESTVSVEGGQTSEADKRQNVPTPVTGGGIPAGDPSNLRVGEFDQNKRASEANQPNALTNAGNGEGGEGNGASGGNGGEGSEGGEEEETDNSDIPANFPARSELIAGGVSSMEQLRGMKRTDILAIKDIGEAKANQIGARLAAMAEESK